MTRTIVWSQDAADDLAAIIAFIQERSGKQTARTVYARIIEKIEKAASFPGIGRAVPELDILGNTDIHEIIEGPWRFLYRFDEHEIRVVSSLDGRRNIEEILYKKLIDGRLT